MATVVSIIAAVDSASHGSPCGSGPHHNSSFIVMQQSLPSGNTTEQADCLNAIWSTRHSRARFIAAQLLAGCMPVLPMCCITDVLRGFTACGCYFPRSLHSVNHNTRLVHRWLNHNNHLDVEYLESDVEALRMLTIAHWWLEVRPYGSLHSTFYALASACSPSGTRQRVKAGMGRVVYRAAWHTSHSQSVCYAPYTSFLNLRASVLGSNSHKSASSFLALSGLS